MWRRLFQIRFIPLIGSCVMLFFIVQIFGKVITEWQSWGEIARNQVETEAAVIGKLAAISDSGGISKYDVTYEFVAPAAPGGYNTSRAAVSKKLEENFFNKPGNIGDIKLPEPRNDGNQYFSKSQTVEPGFANAWNENTIRIVYAQNNPQNSMIRGTGGYPVFWIILILGLMILMGYLAVISALPAFRPSP